MSVGRRFSNRRIHVPVLRAAVPAIFLLLPLAAQSPPPGRQAALIQRGLELMEQGRYAEAANQLEEAWEADPSDASLAENLAICLLLGRKDRTGAFRLMRDALANGGKASVMVEHIHENALLSAGVVADTCKGRLSFSRGALAFVSSQQEHSFSLGIQEVKGLKANRVLGSAQGAFHVETVKGRKINLQPADWSARTTEMIFRLWDMAGKE